MLLVGSERAPVAWYSVGKCKLLRSPPGLLSCSGFLPPSLTGVLPTCIQCPRSIKQTQIALPYGISQTGTSHTIYQSDRSNVRLLRDHHPLTSRVFKVPISRSIHRVMRYFRNTARAWYGNEPESFQARLKEKRACLYVIRTVYYIIEQQRCSDWTHTAKTFHIWAWDIAGTSCRVNLMFCVKNGPKRIQWNTVEPLIRPATAHQNLVVLKGWSYEESYEIKKSLTELFLGSRIKYRGRNVVSIWRYRRGSVILQKRLPLLKWSREFKKSLRFI